MNRLKNLKKEYQQLANPAQAAISRGFFKTGSGEYSEGDIFLGIKVPIQRKIVRKYLDLPLFDLQDLLNSKIHEHRLSALFILIGQYKKADNKTKQRFFKFYLNNTKNINNWDLVDSSSPNIVGDYLLDKPRDILYKLIRSELLWERRISIVSTLAFIRLGQFDDALALAEKSLNDKHDLMHKAAGWMLREVGKRSEAALETFLQKRYRFMPRTMLRYAIEKLSENKINFYLGRSLTKDKKMIKFK
jgi:3-methyladenine DNA glycosylase AlkD